MISNRCYFIFLLSLFCSLFQIAFAQSPSWLWVKGAGGSNNDYPQRSVTDASGNTYVAGFYNSDSISFGNITLANNMTDGSSDIFFVKYNASGNVAWARRAGGNKGDGAYSIAADNNGNIYITGFFSSDSITFGNITVVDSGSGYGNYFLVKSDTAGNIIWETHAEGGSGLGVASDAAGNIYVTGRYQIPSIIFGSTVLTNSGLTDIFTVKYDAAGNILWAKSAGGTNTDFCNGIAAGSNGESYVTGGFRSLSVNFGGITLTNASGLCPLCADMFIARYDSSGNVTWAKRAGENNADNGVVITVDASDNCYVSGYFMSDSIRFDNTTLINNNNDSTNEIFIVKYDTAGNALWAKSGAGDGIDNVGCIAADANGNIYMTGYFSGDTITFGNTALINTDPGTADLFIAGFDSAGNALWAERAGGNGTDVGIGIGTDVGGSGYVAGWYLGDSALFGSSVLTNTAAGYADMFLAKFDFTTGIEKAIDKNNISAFPNPSTGLINISFGRMISHGDITVLNLTGQIIFRENIFNESGKEINLENISSGIYFVKVFDGINYYCRKLIVEHD